MSKSFYLKNITISNIKCFAKSVRLDFYTPRQPEKISNWNLVLGDNGSGKTTLLRCIYLSLTDDFRFDKVDFFNYSRNKKIEGNIKTTICNSFSSTDLLEENPVDNHRRISFQEEFNIKIEGPTLRTNGHQVPVFAYGATRKMANSHFARLSKRKSYGANLFDENSPLINADEWLLEADYLDRLNDGNSNFKQVKIILLKLFKGIISDIRVRNNENSPSVEFKTKYGWVLLSQLSLGYRTVIGWIVDVSYKLTDFYEKSANPLHEAAIVLVDEIDLHLHVSFQKKLVEFLTQTFTKVQFIVTAHSPLVVQSSADANIILLKRRGERTIAKQNEQDISTWRIDQLYASDLFGNVSTRSDKIEQLIHQKSKLLLKKEITEKEEHTLAQINEQLQDLPTATSQFQMEAMDLITRAAKALKK